MCPASVGQFFGIPTGAIVHKRDGVVTGIHLEYIVTFSFADNRLGRSSDLRMPLS